MGFKLILLAILGVGALYLMHLLAQDYMKIRKPAAKLASLLLGKRDIHEITSTHPPTEVDEFDIDWNRILKNDPLSCAQLAICQIVAGAEKENHDAIIINTLVEYALTIGVPKEIESAYNHGILFRKSDKLCYDHYPYCPYSTKTMLKLLQFYSYLFGG